MKSILTATILVMLLTGTSVLADDTFQLTSPDFAEGEKVDPRHQLNAYGCMGENISPALAWSGAP